MLKTEMNKTPDPVETKYPDTQGKNKLDNKNQPSPEQDVLDIFVAQGMKLVMQIAPTLNGKASVDALGNALYNIVNKVETEGMKNGVAFPQWVLIRGTKDILIFLLNSVRVEVTEISVKAIIGIAVGKYMENALNTGKMTKEQAVEIAKQLSQNPIPAGGDKNPQAAGMVAQPDNSQMPMQSGAGGMKNG